MVHRIFVVVDETRGSPVCRAAGDDFVEACREHKKRRHGMDLLDGHARILPSYALKEFTFYIINTRAPHYNPATTKETDEALRLCYRNSLTLANLYDLKSVAFPPIACDHPDDVSFFNRLVDLHNQCSFSSPSMPLLRSLLKVSMSMLIASNRSSLSVRKESCVIVGMRLPISSMSMLQRPVPLVVARLVHRTRTKRTEEVSNQLPDRKNSRKSSAKPH